MLQIERFEFELIDTFWRHFTVDSFPLTPFCYKMNYVFPPRENSASKTSNIVDFLWITNSIFKFVFRNTRSNSDRHWFQPKKSEENEIKNIFYESGENCFSCISTVSESARMENRRVILQLLFWAFVYFQFEIRMSRWRAFRHSQTSETTSLLM